MTVYGNWLARLANQMDLAHPQDPWPSAFHTFWAVGVDEKWNQYLHSAFGQQLPIPPTPIPPTITVLDDWFFQIGSYYNRVVLAVGKRKPGFLALAPAGFAANRKRILVEWIRSRRRMGDTRSVFRIAREYEQQIRIFWDSARDERAREIRIAQAKTRKPNDYWDRLIVELQNLPL